MTTKQQKIPDGWKNYKFDDLCKVNQGLQIPISERFREHKKNRLLYITIQYLNKKSVPEYIEEYNDSVVCDTKDILMTRTGNTGIVVTGVKGVFHNNFFKVKPFETKIRNKLFVYILKSPSIQYKLLSLAGTGTIPDLNHGDFYSIHTILPSLPEQIQIVEVLKTWDLYLKKLARKIETKKQIKKGLMQQLLTGKKRLPGFSGKWKNKKVREIFDYIKTYAYSREKLIKNGFLGNGIGNIHYGDIHSTYLSTSININNTEIPQLIIVDIEIKKGDLLKDGDIIMADASEDYEGVSVAITVHGLQGKKVLGGLHTFVLRDKKNITDVFYRQFIFCNNEVKSQLRKVATGVSVLGISKTNLNNISIPLPEKEEQNAIAEVLTTADKEIEVLEKQRNMIADQKKFLLNKLLTGEIRLPEFVN